MQHGATSVIDMNRRADLAESARLEALHALDILDTPPEEGFDRISRLIRDIFDVETALVSMIDAHRQWYKSRIGIGAAEANRRETFCQHVVREPEPLIVRDATLDRRFRDNVHVTGEPFVRFYAGVPLTTPEGHTIGTVCAIDRRPREFGDRDLRILTDLASIAMDELTLRERASVDPLTGALTRGAFRREATKTFALSRRHGHALSVVVFDLDHFKRINDRFGHAAGDNVLIEAAEICRANLRQSDVFGRLGGEEFAALLPHTPRRQALEVAEKLRKAFAMCDVAFAGGSTRFTGSFGVAASDGVTAELDALLVNADVALYEAKAGGRNRSVAWLGHEEKDTRRRVLKAGRAIFNERHSVIDCTVRTLGPTGAGLGVSSSMDLPDRFTLAIRSDGFEASCQVTARSERHVEVVFD
jgi:diguanylate cyclase (GGDEF)-like protein